MKETNKYLTATEGGVRIPFLLRSAADYVTHIFRVFGLVDSTPGLGFNMSTTSAGAAGEASLETTLAPYLDVLASFREQVRDAARAKDTGKVLATCDTLRDVELPVLGVVLEDGVKPTPGTSSWKLRDPEELKREAEEKKRVAEEKKRQKAEAEAERKRKMDEKIAAASVPPAAMFRSQIEKYSAFDDAGVPTHAADGTALGDKVIKKLRSEWEKQKKNHEWFLALPPAAAPSAGAGAGAE